jgi:hypothetical protein
MHATCYNKDRTATNSTRLTCQFGLTQSSLNIGVFALTLQLLTTQGLGLPTRFNFGLFSVGMMVKLVTNLIPEKCLINNAWGFVRDWIYIDEDLTYDPANQSRMPVCGNPCVHRETYDRRTCGCGKGKCVAIAPMELRCDCNVCHRYGLLLACAKADSIHS